MQLIQTTEAMHAWADAQRQEGRRIALVPTMGALHAGHLQLVRQARAHADVVVVSIFVNPTQFGPNEDYTAYPRTLAADQAALASVGDMTVFAPSADQMYPYGPDAVRFWVKTEQLDDHLCGHFRPGHFLGVTTVVSKLFNLCKPHVAFFGLKDAQQFLILRRMVRELHFDVQLIGVPTVREPDGLAMSSRNVYLSPEERRQAVVLSEAVGVARHRIEAGEQRVSAVVEAMLKTMGRAPDARVQYAEVVDTETLQPLERLAPGQEVLAAVAVHFGRTRLIDNTFTTVPVLVPANQS